MRRLEERMAKKRLIALGREAERAKRAIDAGYTGGYPDGHAQDMPSADG